LGPSLDLSDLGVSIVPFFIDSDLDSKRFDNNLYWNVRLAFFFIFHLISLSFVVNSFPFPYRLLLSIFDHLGDAQP
jgi:hypothetical protein